MALANVPVTAPELKVRGGKVHELRADDEPAAGFKLLVSENITSAPVYDEGAKQYIGYLDIRDLVSRVVFHGERTNQDDQTFRDQVTCGSGSAMGNITTSYLARRNRFVSVTEDASLRDVIDAMLVNEIKRVAVVNGDGRITNIISLSTVCDYLSKNDAFFAGVADRLVNDVLASTIKPMITIREDEESLEAFKTMERYHITGLPLVGSDGRMVSVISGKDLRAFIANPTYSALHTPIIETVKQLRQATAIDVRVPAITVRPDATFRKVLEKMVACRIHRVYVHEDNRPVGVITFRDLVRTISSADGN